MLETILISVITAMITSLCTQVIIEYIMKQRAIKEYYSQLNDNDYDDMDGITLREEVFDYLDDLQESGEIEDYDNLYALAEKIHSEIYNHSLVDEVVSIIEEWKHLQRNE